MLEIDGDSVRVTLAPATPHAPRARLRIEQPAAVNGVGTIVPADRYAVERGAYVIPLSARNHARGAPERAEPERGLRR